MVQDPQSVIDQGKMSTWQWTVVVVMAALNALDGFDVLSISFASPGIAKDWRIDKATLGWVLSMELLGMAAGSMFLGSVADKVGRRPLILGCLLSMAIGMFGASLASGIETLLPWRLLTGVGIGGMLASINAATAEVSNRRWRSMAMSIMVVGYPVGGVIGGLVVKQVLTSGTWRDVFTAGAAATAMFIPIVWWAVPESVSMLYIRRGPGVLERINRILMGFGHTAVHTLGPREVGARRSLIDIFKPGLLSVTALVTLAYFLHITSFYFLLKWVPKIIVDMGFAPTAAAGVLLWVNIGAVAGCSVFGLIATRLSLKRLTIATLIGSSATIIAFGHGGSDLVRLTVFVTIAGFFTNSTVVGLYSIFANVFPTHVRATGTGFAVGVGRGGAIIAPVLAGYLFQAGFSLQTVATLMSLGSLIGAIALIGLKETGPPPARRSSGG